MNGTGVLDVSSNLSVLGSNFTRPILESYASTKVSDNPDASNFIEKLKYTNFLVYNQKFYNIIGTNPKLEVLAKADYPFAHEGGAYVAESDEVFFSSNRLDNQKTQINKINLSTKKISTVIPKDPIFFSNGMCYYNGKVIICSQGKQNVGGSIVSLDPISNEVTTIVDNFFGLKFNSPNDIIVSKDGHYWFTDPSYGYEQGFRDAPQLGNYVYRFDPSTGSIRVVSDDFIKPNGIAFSPDEKTLYITDTGFFDGTGEYDPKKPHAVYAFDVNGSIIYNRRIFAVVDVGIPDGIKLDFEGNVYVGAGDGVQVFDNSGILLGKIIIPNGAPNLIFVKNTLIIFAETVIYSVDLKMLGAFYS
ncbi:calcium-dependent phosphotriesterase [Gigaspora margarita]|uniref:Calcium-dependent phosphotriesterase n=1 Tax=Gigaspora margarita TaxID=4874 RepID=A0A8H3X426_GIGMA|nr:calcium-dependent phosphotriesterase [Gigaspora margarita]